MHLTVHRNRLDHFPPITFEAAVMVVQLNLVDLAQHQVEDPAGQYLVPGILPAPLPAANDVPTFLHLF